MRASMMPRGTRSLATAAAAKPASSTPGRPVPTRLQFIELESLNPLVNLATEEWIFDRADVASTRTIVVYRNAPCVVLGAHQNLWKEVNVAIARTRGIQLIRRESGGGTVFHDAGNLNYCFMTHRSLFNKAMGSTVLADALAHIGVPATLNARQDVALNDRKISGSAFRITRDRCFQHGTLLVSADLARLGQVLRHDPRLTFESSASVDSVRSPVINIRDVRPATTISEVIGALREAAVRTQQPQHVESLRLTELEALRVPAVASAVDRLRSWDNLYGRSPAFVVRVRAHESLPDVVISAERGLITAWQPDATHRNHALAADLAEMGRVLIGTPFNESGMRVASLASSGDPISTHLAPALPWDPLPSLRDEAAAAD